MEGLWGTFLTLTLVYPAAYLIPGAGSDSDTHSHTPIHIHTHDLISFLSFIYFTLVLVCLPFYLF